MTEETTPTNRTENQRAASRANGARSRGPRTSAGKAVSSGNRLKHNLLAQTILLEEESRISFNRSIETLESMFHPRDPFESSLIQMMAVAAWRHTRLLEMERAAIRIQTLPASAATLEPAARAFLAYQLANRDHSLEYFNRQSLRLDRQYHHALKSLNDYRSTKTKLSETKQTNEPENPQVRST